MAATLFITRGLPASGKSTWAREQLAKAPLGTVVRLNRDDLRRMSRPAGYGKPHHKAEQAISAVRCMLCWGWAVTSSLTIRICALATSAV